MIMELQERIAGYISRNALISDWRSIREHYARYSYLTFMCLIANAVHPDCKAEEIGDILCDHRLEDKEIVQYALSTEKSLRFLREITGLIKEQEARDINEIYQEFLARDFVLIGHTVSFDGNKNNRDILGSYYTPMSVS